MVQTVIETVTLRYEGPIRNVRALRRQLELLGFAVRFGSEGLVMNDPMWPGRNVNGRWYQVVVSGPDSEQECRTIVATWSESGTLSLV